jgi:hypothetical protein
MKTNEDRLLESVRTEHFPESEERQWPPPGGGWFKAPRTLPLLLQVLTQKNVVQTGNPGLAYIDLLARVRETGVVILEHPEDHARTIGYSRARTWLEAMRKLRDLGFIETKANHEREFAYVLLVNPYIPVKRLFQAGRLDAALWSLFHEKWNKAQARIPAVPETSEVEATLASEESSQ